MFSVGRNKIPKCALLDGIRKEIAELISRLLSLDTKSRPTAVEAMEELENLNPTFEKTLKLLKELKVEPLEMNGHSIVDEKKKKTLLHYVCENGNVEVLKELLREDSDLNVRADMNEFWKDCTPLHFAAYNGKVACLKLLIEAGADLNAKENDGWTALHWAAANGKVDCVKALIEAGADLNAKANGGSTALHWAARNGKVDCVKALIDAGADLNAKRKSLDCWFRYRFLKC